MHGRMGVYTEVLLIELMMFSCKNAAIVLTKIIIKIQIRHIEDWQ